MITIPGEWWPGPPQNANDRPGNPHARARSTHAWRDLGIVVARAHHVQPLLPPVFVLAEFRWPTDRVRDTANYYPAVKALIDGLVQAGALAGDDDTRMVGPWLARVRPNGRPEIRLTLRPIPNLHQPVHLLRST